jgi:hypothetical protein
VKDRLKLNLSVAKKKPSLYKLIPTTIKAQRKTSISSIISLKHPSELRANLKESSRISKITKKRPERKIIIQRDVGLQKSTSSLSSHLLSSPLYHRHIKNNRKHSSSSSNLSEEFSQMEHHITQMDKLKEDQQYGLKQ